MNIFIKITIGVIALAALLLVYFGYQFILVEDYKLVATEKYILLQNADNSFTNAALFITLAIWFWVNVVIIKTKQLFWLIIPYLFTIFSIVISAYFSDKLFIFKKQNIGFDGSFSIGYIAAILFIVFISFVAVINYVISKRLLQKKM